MPLPSNITSITLTATYTALDGSPQSGFIVFDPGQVILDSGGQVILAGPVTRYLQPTGVMTPVVLPCTDNAALNPTGFPYTITEHVGAQQQRSWSAQLPHTLGSTVDLSALSPVSPAPPATAFGSNNAWTGTNTFNGETIVPAPVNPSDAATKAYADGAATAASAYFLRIFSV